MVDCVAYRETRGERTGEEKWNCVWERWKGRLRGECVLRIDINASLF